MKPILLLKTILYLLGFVGAFVRFIEPVYVFFFSKPAFVHFYIVKKNLPKKEKEFLVQHVSFYKKLTEEYKLYFEHRVAMFLRTYEFIPRENFVITPEVKVLIASSYVKLTFGMRNYLTNVFTKILVYPAVFYSVLNKQYHKGEFNPSFKMIVFSWENFLLGDIVTNDNLNLGIHEFSHALTFHGRKSNDVSAAIFYDGFTSFIHFMNHQKEGVLIRESSYFRKYAFENSLELLAVIMEHFFETPKSLQREHPKVYSQIESMLNYKRILKNSIN